jgi:hypothetical protein
LTPALEVGKVPETALFFGAAHSGLEEFTSVEVAPAFELDETAGLKMAEIAEASTGAAALANATSADAAAPPATALMLVEATSRAPVAPIGTREAGSRVSIGRLSIAAPTAEQRAFISRDHAAVVIGPTGTLILEDRGTTNGTFLNGFRVSGPVMLVEGDEVRIGGGQNIAFNSKHTRFPEWSWRLIVVPATVEKPEGIQDESESLSGEPRPAKKAKTEPGDGHGE